MPSLTLTQGGDILINHPDFGDVYNTTYKKGVISDFEVLEEDPFQVVSRVKVKIDNKESDYIPIFFRPKALYWDTEEPEEAHEATEFNQDGKYYANAYMSFRCDDEVVVMLTKGEPAAVVGFYDGVPRIGEKLFKCTDVNDNKAYYKAPTLEKYADEEDELFDIGLDEVPLNLLQEIERFENDSTKSYPPTYGDLSHPNGVGVQAWSSDVPGYEYTSLGYTKTYTVKHFQLRLWLVRVGPLLVALFIAVVKGERVAEHWYATPYQAGWNWMVEVDGEMVPDWASPSYHEGEAHTEINDWSMWEHPYDDNIPPPWPGYQWSSGPNGVSLPITTIDESWGPAGQCLKVGLYSDELYQETISYFNGLDIAEIYDSTPVAEYLIDGEMYAGKLDYHDWLPDAPEGLKFQ